MLKNCVLFYFTLACATIDALNSCSVATVAPKGSTFILFLTTTAGSAVIGIVAQAPNTKVNVTCYNIPLGVNVKTVSQQAAYFNYINSEHFNYIYIVCEITCGCHNTHFLEVPDVISAGINISGHKYK